jgi:hypothetical protein
MIRLIKYIPWHSKISIITYENNMINFKKIRHPGNTWIFKTPVFKFPDGSYIKPINKKGDLIFFKKSIDIFSDFSTSDDKEYFDKKNGNKFEKKIYKPNINLIYYDNKLYMFGVFKKRFVSELTDRFEKAMDEYKRFYYDINNKNIEIL